MKPRVLRVDNHLLFLEKPAGMPTVPDESGDESLLDWAKAWVAREFAKPGAVFLGVVHRLDRPVSGVVLFARTSKAAARLSAQFRARTVRKRYLGVGLGEPAAREGLVEQWLVKDELARRVRPARRESPGAREARTRWRVLAVRGGRTLLCFEPLTGRPHQLRAAAASLGTPLLGDVKYGAKVPLADRSVALHALSLEVAHPTRGEPVGAHCAPTGEAWLPFASDIADAECPGSLQGD
jgi:23S rRNA pseudouridine1911/1915/1917 synthase